MIEIVESGLRLKITCGRNQFVIIEASMYVASVKGFESVVVSQVIVFVHIYNCSVVHMRTDWLLEYIYIYMYVYSVQCLKLAFRRPLINAEIVPYESNNNSLWLVLVCCTNMLPLIMYRIL